MNDIIEYNPLAVFHIIFWIFVPMALALIIQTLTNYWLYEKVLQRNVLYFILAES